MTGKISVTQIKDRQQFLNSTNEATDASNLFNICESDRCKCSYFHSNFYDYW